MAYNTAAIRELLDVVFDDEALTIFCFDHFRPVYQQFAAATVAPRRCSKTPLG